jgi:hypothetical protein
MFRDGSPARRREREKGRAAMKIDVIGAWNIGSTAGALWVNAGHDAMYEAT